MNKSAKKIKVFLALAPVLASFVFLIPQASAEDSFLQSAIREVKESVGVFIQTKDKNTSEKDKEDKKLEAAKETLTKILNLALLEISTTRERLDDMEIEKLVAADYTFDAADVYESLSRLIEYYEAFHRDTLKRVAALKDYESARSLAKELKNWREKTYSPGIQKILALDLVLRNKAIIGIANARFEKILADLRKLKNSKLITFAEIEELLSSATANLKSAEAVDAEATRIVLKMLKTTSINPDNENFDENERIISEYKRISNLVDQSIIKIRGAYKKFLEINSSVKKALELE